MARGASCVLICLLWSMLVMYGRSWHTLQAQSPWLHRLCESMLRYQGIFSYPITECSNLQTGFCEGQNPINPNKAGNWACAHEHTSANTSRTGEFLEEREPLVSSISLIYRTDRTGEAKLGLLAAQVTYAKQSEHVPLTAWARIACLAGGAGTACSCPIQCR